MKQSTRVDSQQYPLPDEVYEDLANKMYTPILLGENVVVALPPLFGKDHAVRYMWERHWDRSRVLGAKTSQFLFAHIPLAFTAIGDTSPWILQLLQGLGMAIPTPTFDNLSVAIKETIDSGKEPVFFINIPESLPDDVLRQFFEFAQSIYYIAPNQVHFIIVLDYKWNEADFISAMAPYRSLLQHLIQPRLYLDTHVQPSYSIG